jgi:hypothetical protein
VGGGGTLGFSVPISSCDVSGSAQNSRRCYRDNKMHVLFSVVRILLALATGSAPPRHSIHVHMQSAPARWTFIKGTILDFLTIAISFFTKVREPECLLLCFLIFKYQNEILITSHL